MKKRFLRIEESNKVVPDTDIGYWCMDFNNTKSILWSENQINDERSKTLLFPVNVTKTHHSYGYTL